jgi:hypothetical protein
MTTRPANLSSKPLKYEEVYRNEYRDFQEARGSIAEFLERVYNQQRLHSALGYVPLRSLSRTEAPRNEVAGRHIELGALPPNPRDLPQFPPE